MKHFGKAASSDLLIRSLTSAKQKRLLKSEEYFCRCSGLGALDSQLTITLRCFFADTFDICHEICPGTSDIFFWEGLRKKGRSVI